MLARLPSIAPDSRLTFRLSAVVVIFLNFHQLAVAKFQQIARQDPRQRLAFVCLPENDVSEDKYHTPNAIEASAVVPGASLIDIPGMPPSQYSFSSSSSSSTSSSSSSFATSVSSFSEAHYPILEVAYSWGLAAFRYGKALQRQHDAEAAHKHFHQAAKLMQYIIEEETSPRTWTVLVFKKLPKVLESIAQVRPSDRCVFGEQERPRQRDRALTLCGGAVRFATIAMHF